MKKGQTSMEFVFLIGLAFTITLIFSVVSLQRNQELQLEEEFILVKDIAFKVQQELNLAARVESGYRREFETPPKLGQSDYTMAVYNSFLRVTTKNVDYELSIPTVNGTIQKGANIIQRKDGIIQLN